MTEHTEHDLVWVTSPDMSKARQKCRSCRWRSDWVDVPPELRPGGPGEDSTFGDLTAEGGKG